ncbi:MAG: glycosyl hydrolase, partial [Actinomycetia bacterium]|nr:glycosyl hydrolase [Actinomycetes bacterium]
LLPSGQNLIQEDSGRGFVHDLELNVIDPARGITGTRRLYETFDDCVSWRHFPNMAISQFYRVALDNSEPFYNILGGAQDLGTLFGPSRTMHVDGVRNQDWYVPLGSDGYHVAFDPDDPETSYLEWQVGNVMRYDRRTMELQDIQPQPKSGEPPERWNWDTPILISPHESARIYVASQRLWRSNDRGDSWAAISEDLTKSQERLGLPTGGRVESIDALYDHEAMSYYGTITHITESPLAEGVLYVGTDDGLIQVTEDGGSMWRVAAGLPGVTDDAFVNDVEASRHDADGVFAVADAHKNGDYSPYVFESPDRGRTWRSISGDLPDGTIVWAIEQDHVNPDLLFLGTEFGIYVSLNRGGNWDRFTRDVPMIAFRDIKLHRRDDDLVGASFGRGIYILDDYGPLRQMSPDALARPAVLFGVRDAWRYVSYQPMQAAGQPTLGSSAFRAPNPPFGATFTYRIAADYQTKKKERIEAEKQIGPDTDVPFAGWDTLWIEHLDVGPRLFLVVSDDEGNPIRRIEAETKAGVHRSTWDLRFPPPAPVRLEKPDFELPWDSPPKGPLVPSGNYSVELVLVTPEATETVSGPETFAVKATAATDRSDNAEDTAFQVVSADLARRASGAAAQLQTAGDKLKHLRAALVHTPGETTGLFQRLEVIHRRREELARFLSGDPVRQRLSEPAVPSIIALIERVMGSHFETTQPPTQAQRESIDRATAAFAAVTDDLRTLVDDLAELSADIDAAGGPWTPR